MQLEEKIIKKKAKIGVVGLGYVGLPLAVEYASKGFTTIGIDIDKSKVEKLNRGENYILDVDSEKVKKLVKSGRLLGTMTLAINLVMNKIYIFQKPPNLLT